MNILTHLFGSRDLATQAQLALSAANGALSWRELYALLKAYYLQNNLYESLRRARYEESVWMAPIKEIRNPANRAVEVYAGDMFGGPLDDSMEIKAERDAIVEPIRKVWEWSNWPRRKQVFARWSALYGTVFIKVPSNEARTRVWFQLIEPAMVPTFEVDERDFLTYIRIDVPITRRDGDTLRMLTQTEVWDKAAQTLRIWEHDKPDGTDTELLGAPRQERPFSEFGIDFIPIVLHKHRDIGEDRGVGCFTHALTKIDEVNRSAARLHQQLFRSNKATWAVESAGRDASGRIVPPPAINGATEMSNGTATRSVVTVGDDEMWRMPGGWSLRQMVPDLKYADALAILNASMSELEDDIPVLTLARIREVPDASGVALRYRLLAAIKAIREARANGFESLFRADAMALTLGQVRGIPGFEGVGSFEAGDFAHTFEDTEIIPLDGLTEAQEELARAQAFTTATGATMPVTEAMQRIYNLSEEQATQMADMMTTALEQQANQGGQQ